MKKVYPILGGALAEAPCYEPHRRGRNWMAKIHPNADAPGGWERDFARTSRGKDTLYMTTDIFVGNLLEFGADYVTGQGKKVPLRQYAVVIDKDSDSLVLEVFDTALEAWTFRRDANMVAPTWVPPPRNPPAPLDATSFTVAEVILLRVLLHKFAESEREDLIGLVLKMTGSTVLSTSDERVAFVEKIEGDPATRNNADENGV